MKNLTTGLNELKNELQNIICRTDDDGEGQLIKTAQAYLRESFATGTGIKEKKYSREQEEEKLREFITLKKLWLPPESFGTYITEGAEQKVYFPENSKNAQLLHKAHRKRRRVSY